MISYGEPSRHYIINQATKVNITSDNVCWSRLPTDNVQIRCTSPLWYSSLKAITPV